MEFIPLADDFPAIVLSRMQVTLFKCVRVFRLSLIGGLSSEVRLADALFRIR